MTSMYDLYDELIARIYDLEDKLEKADAEIDRLHEVIVEMSLKQTTPSDGSYKGVF